MNEVIKTIKERRSIRSFKPDMPPKADIEQIIEAGLYAPSGMGRQPVVTIAITDPKIRDQIAMDNARIGGWKEDFDPFYGAPVILLVLGSKEAPTSIYDGSLVMENMMIAATSLGLGSIWIHRAKEECEMPTYKAAIKALGLEGEWEGIGHLAIGYINGDVPEAAPRKDGRVFWVEDHE